MLYQETVDYKLSKAYTIKETSWSLTVATSDTGAMLYGGCLGEFTVRPSELFTMKLKDQEGQEVTVSSTDGWNDVYIDCSEELIKIFFTNPNGISDIAVDLLGRVDSKGISWSTKIINRSSIYSVTMVTYPMPLIAGETLHLFWPDRCGRVMKDVGNNGVHIADDYPGFLMAMQYVAYWGDKQGLYLGIEDPNASMKRYIVKAEGKESRTTVEFPAIGASEVGNSFALGGCVRWEVFSGDWYDATMLYRDFVLKNAKWLPEKGRPDTAKKYQDIAMWANYTTNQATFNGILDLRKILGYPMATHAYFWHQVKFDTDYPHFMPAKEVAEEAFRALQKEGVYVVPYINGVSWDTSDVASGYEMNYETVGCKGVAITPDGTPLEVHHGSFKDSGHKVNLAAMCPGFTKWHDIMYDLVRDMESNLAIDGVYFDQVAAVTPVACRSKEHNHVPGGGSYWSELYNEMINKIKAGRTRDTFYFTECNGEPYTNSFDGVLTWQWNTNDLVPAYPAIYAGYVQMVGRSIAFDAADDNYFRYHFADAVMYGQQPGWFDPVPGILSEERIAFVKKCVDVRMENIELLNHGRLLRTPTVQSDVPTVETAKGTHPTVIAQVWQADDKKTVLFVSNITDSPITATVKLFTEEYGVSCDDTMTLELPATSIRTIVLK